MDEQEASGQIQIQKRSIQKVEARAGRLGRRQGNSPSSQVRKTKALTELNLAGNVKDSKSFSRHISDERKIKENVGLP